MKSIIVPSDTNLPIIEREFADLKALGAYFGSDDVTPCVETVVGLGEELHASAVLDETPWAESHNAEINSRADIYMNKGGSGNYVGDMILVGGSMLTTDGPVDVPFDIAAVEERIAANVNDPGANAEASAEEEEREDEVAEVELESILEGDDGSRD